MNAVPVPDSVMRRLPGWTGATSELLHGGLSNRTWLLEKNGRRAVLKIDDEPREPPLNTREQEASIQAVAADAGLATDVLYVADGLYLTDYAAGEVWSAATLADSTNLERLAEALCRVHLLPRTGRLFGARLAARRYADAIDFDEAVVARCVAVIEDAATPRRSCLCHNDLVAENILATPSIRFLDWEYACDNDPLFDLATVIEHHELDECQAAHLLDAYFDGDGDSNENRLHEQRRVYRALLWLWLASRPETPQQDLQHAARRLTTSDS